jgi:hypothetical protein
MVAFDFDISDDMNVEMIIILIFSSKYSFGMLSYMYGVALILLP